MDGFDDDFSPLQGSGARNTSSIDPPLCPTGNISISPSILDENNADLKEGDDVPALRLSPSPPDDPLSTDSSELSTNGEKSATTSISTNKIKKPKEKKEDPEVIRKWKEQQIKDLEKKDEAEEEAKLQLRAQAKQELDDWYKQHAEQLTKLQEANRSASESAEQEILSTTHEISPGTEWERVAKLCDFNPKTGRTPSKDVGRMRSVILQLKEASRSNAASH